MKTILFYLEPYCFIFEGNEGYIVYNTLNSTYISSKHNRMIEDILKQLQDEDNGYALVLSVDVYENKQVKEWIGRIRDSFSGDIEILDDKEMKPFIFKPSLRIYNDIKTIRKEEGRSLGESILRHLSEVTIHIPQFCDLGCVDCEQYCKQMVHCTKDKDHALTEADYQILFKQLDAAGTPRVNLVGGKCFSASKLFINLWRILVSYPFEKYLYILYADFNEHVLTNLGQNNASLVVQIRTDCLSEMNGILENMRKYEKCQIEWNFIIESKKDLEKVASLHTSSKISVTPFYNGTNLSFFENMVYLSLEDLLRVPTSKQSIFRRQVLNENLYGMLTILSNGDVYANMNHTRLGNLYSNSLAELVYKELESQESWLLTRNQVYPCKQCVNRYLCPSISNYELVIGKNDLCQRT